jgi:hypothetical protein
MTAFSRRIQRRVKLPPSHCHAPVVAPDAPHVVLGHRRREQAAAAAERGHAVVRREPRGLVALGGK